MEKVDHALIKSVEAMTQGEIAAICNSVSFKEMESFESGLNGHIDDDSNFDGFLAVAAPHVAEWLEHN
jgi:hypothetical protein